MIKRRVLVAIDGPVGAGKSTVAKMVAKRLNIVHIDTGAMYRSVALYAIENNVDVSDLGSVLHMLVAINIDIKVDENGQKVFLNNRDVTNLIRTPNVSEIASEVATISQVRQKLVLIQRNIADKTSVVMDGRDIGTVVLPQAQVKIFLTASEEERAKRRHEELLKRGENISYEEVLKNLQTRDNKDMTRKNTPLKPASDAVILDTTGLEIEDVVTKIVGMVG